MSSRATVVALRETSKVNRFSLRQWFKKWEPRCSFCNNPQSAVRQLIAGASAFICDECVAICDGVVAQHATSPGERPHATGEIAICLVCKRGKAGPDCILVPGCGPVCLECVDAVRAAAPIESRNH
jgi:hypothetical protein